METGELLLRVAAGVINVIKEDLTKRNADYAQQKRSENLRKGSIDVEYKIIKD